MIIIPATLAAHPKIIDRTGQHFGRLTVKSFAGIYYQRSRGGPKAAWRCVCICGKETIVPSHCLISGNTKSCGCLGLEHQHHHGKKHKQHPNYNIWCAIIGRCTNSNNWAYKYYGGRGIIMDPRWRHSFENFVTDVGLRPSSKHSIERIDNNGPYTKSNCCWVLPHQQRRNSRHLILFTIDNKTQCLKDWCREKHISYHTVLQRYRKLGWDIKRALTTPAKLSTGQKSR